jgi:16S rRNA (cytidine1402-2'-O)-methyltransferase
MAKLCLVPTPIGNLEDITLRSLRILKEADIIFAEDTRVTKKLLAHFEISQHVLPFHSHNEHKTLQSTIDKIKSCELAVLVSDAGTPGISDPGFLLTRECVNQDIPLECLPGPTAFIPALVASGFPCDRFAFEGFLPHKKGRQTKLMAIEQEERTVVLYESPHRLVKCLAQIEEFMGPERKVCVAREISKIYEEFKRGTAQEIKTYYEQHPPKGEIVIVIEGKNAKN